MRCQQQIYARRRIPKDESPIIYTEQPIEERECVFGSFQHLFLRKDMFEFSFTRDDIFVPALPGLPEVFA